MYFLESTSRDPRFNLALEERLFNSDGEYLMLWQNAPSVIVGKFQNAPEEADLRYCAEHNIPVVRRLTGGGAVYHDEGNLNYSILVRERDEAPDFRTFAAPVIRALERFGVRAEFNGRNDLTVEGKKISGCSQSIRNARVLHHGCILLDSDLETLSRALKGNKEKYASRGIGSVVSRVTTVNACAPQRVEMADFRRALAGEILAGGGAEPYALTPEDLRAAEKLRDEKYAAWEWNIGYGATYAFTNRRRFPWGTVSVAMDAEAGRIRSVKFSGDFFGEDVGALEEGLRGAALDEKLPSVLSGLDTSRHIRGCAPEDLAELLLE